MWKLGSSACEEAFSITPSSLLLFASGKKMPDDKGPVYSSGFSSLSAMVLLKVMFALTGVSPLFLMV